MSNLVTENTLSITVAICTHNPKDAFLGRTLDGLKQQTLPHLRWELLVIDNNSEPPVAPRHSLEWHPLGKWIVESKLGLNHARLAALKNARGNTIVFVDDDNILREDYLQNVLDLRSAHADIGTFGAGIVLPEFSSPPPSWLREFNGYGYLALRNVNESHILSSPKPGYRPVGAGLCISVEVAKAFLSASKEDHAITAYDRKGTSLMSGGDDLFTFMSLKLGMKYAIFPELMLCHLIPESRLEYSYFQRLVYYGAYSQALLADLFGISTDNPHPLPSIKTAFAMLLQGRVQLGVSQLGLVLRYISRSKKAKGLYCARFSGWEDGLAEGMQGP